MLSPFAVGFVVEGIRGGTSKEFHVYGDIAIDDISVYSLCPGEEHSGCTFSLTNLAVASDN